MPTDKDDQDSHFFYNHPERGGGYFSAWAVNAAPTAAAVWAERTCEVAGDAAQNARAVL